jgi:GNAT superfamily N-acetyltransferase
VEGKGDTSVRIRVATAADQAEITRIGRSSPITPFGLRWRRFLVAEDHENQGRIVGMGQVKRHGDGSRELASIAVIKGYRHKGVASAIINALLAREAGALYLVCRDSLETFYNRFGFVTVGREELSPYFRRLARIANPPRFLRRLWGMGDTRVLFMKRVASPAAR